MIKRIKEIYKETKCRVRGEDGVSEEFWVEKGVRQGCPISQLRHLHRRPGRGYADDIVLLAESEEELKAMIERARRYFERKKLEVSGEKTKIMVARKNGGKRKEKKWKWGDKEIEEAKEMKYLGYNITNNNTEEAPLRERVRKAKIAMASLWGIGERQFRGDIRWRIKLFDARIKRILMFGAEIWGWKECEEIEKVQEKYIRWILGAERTTPGYVIRDELKRHKIRVAAGMPRGTSERGSEGEVHKGRQRETTIPLEMRNRRLEAERLLENDGSLEENAINRDKEV
ncbi:uncharacterized protein LOC124406211 [Diprion similis]|uniref:uncharacterized protein LOC124406211 n=1 Tax=Diprion similis TaxID=362088 RepID=UPI001EF8DCAF|nr:uncharacterized protein LOC124406211 [Diprion similis]